jgi:antitoxin (DNA-binding transcriptional repressor) of toxin-antitoxin stability system
MPTLHISETEAARDFAGLLARVREGAEIIIESEHDSRAVLLAPQPKDGSIDATLGRLKTLADKRGHELIMDPDFAADMEEIIRNRKPREIKGSY